MCGLVALISKRGSGFFYTDLKFMENLLLLDAIRGEDSTGVFSVSNTHEVDVVKIGSHPLHLYNTKAWQDHKTSLFQRGRICVGHNRKATTGSVSSENAHPFHEGTIILSHNGTLREDHRKLADTEVDSHAVCHSFNTRGAEETLATLDGAFAFIWWDTQKQKLFAIRNDERPLFLVTCSSFHILCSEPWMAKELLSREHVTVTEVVSLPPGTLYSFDIDGSFSTKVITTYSPPPIKWQYSYPSYKDEDVYTNYYANNSKVAVTPCPYKKGDYVKVAVGDVFQIRDGIVRVTGKTFEANKISVDFVGHISGIPKDAIGKSGTAKVLAVASTSCGLSLWIDYLKIDTIIKLWYTTVSEDVWEDIVYNQVCNTCGSGINHEDSPFTSVSKNKQTEQLTILCCNCLEKKLPKRKGQK